MKIIIPRIPNSATKSDLQRFVMAGLKRRFRLAFLTKPQIVDCDVVRVKDERGSAERHGIVTVVPDRAGDTLAKSLHGMRLNGKRLAARPFVNRKHKPIRFDPERNRRRPNLSIERELLAETEGYDQFARVLASRAG